MKRSGGWRRPVAATLVVLVSSLGLAACTDDGEPTPAPTPKPTLEEKKLTFGLWGSEDEIGAFDYTVANFNRSNDVSDVVIEPYVSRDALVDALREGAEVPDVFMVSRGDLAWLRENDFNLPLDELLDERGADFGDRYSRSALEAFSADRRLQCMPYGVSPMVIYYNKDLIDFERMNAQGIEMPAEDATRWTFDQFKAAAEAATRPRRGTKGVHIDPTLQSWAPFIYSGGGNLLDDGEDPTSLAFSDDASRESLATFLELVRDPNVTLTDQQLERRSGLEWFKRGRVGMIEGFRGMVPELRQVTDLNWDIMPMPVLEKAATVGDLTGICISRETASPGAAADFVMHALSTEAVKEVTSAGFLVPANQEVALSDDFLQPGRQPDRSDLFNTSVRSMVVPPMLDVWPALNTAVGPILEELMNVTLIEDLALYTDRIDEVSRPILDPEGYAEEQAEEAEQSESEEE